MDPVALLTILTLIVAVYAIVPPERRLDFRLRLNWIDWVLISFAIFSIHYISYYPVFQQLSVPSLGYWRWGFDPSNTSYLIVLLSTTIIILRAKWAPLRVGKIGLFHQLSEHLLQESKYSDLLFLLEHHRVGLFRIYDSASFFSHIKKKLDQPVDLILYLQEKHDLTDARSSWTDRLTIHLIALGSRLAPMIPSGEKKAKIAQDVVRRLLLSEDFVAHIAKTRPYLALEILTNEFFERDDFLELYIRQILSYRSSVVYFEIQNNQNVSSFHRYTIDDRNRFLSFFLRDANVANKLGIFKPFGDYALDHLDLLARDPSTDSYNGPIGNFDEQDRWRCPIHTVIRFFDIMVPEALFQGIEWHMWLYYFPLITDRVIRNLAPRPSLDHTKEWLTPYHYLLYQLISTLCDWIKATAKVPADQPNVALKGVGLDHENGNIPKSTIMALGQSLYHILCSDSVDAKSKAYLLDIVLRCLRDMSEDPNVERFSPVLQLSVLRGGGLRGRELRYLQQLRTTFLLIDTILRLDLEDFERELNRQ